MLGSDSRDSRPRLNYVAAPRLDLRPAMTFAPVIFNSVESQRLSPAQQKCQISSTQIHAEKPRFSSAHPDRPPEGEGDLTTLFQRVGQAEVSSRMTLAPVSEGS